MAKVVFKINGIQYEADGRYSPDVTLNEYIRTVADLRGTKAMCHEGGCGACIVSIRAASPPTNEVKTFAVNSCLVSVLSCHGWEITTVEGIGNKTIGYHEIQSRLAKFNGTQCGYCTPGWVMNMYSLYTEKNMDITAEEVENSFAGNICRCTGYRPIVDAFKSFAKDADEDLKNKLVDIEEMANFKCCGVRCTKNCKHNTKKDKVIETKYVKEDDWCVLEKSNNSTLAIKGANYNWFKLFKLNDVFKTFAQCDEYKMVAGNTGQGVYHVTGYPKCVIDIFSVAELKGYIMDVNLILGAGMPLTEMMEIFAKLSSESDDFAYLKEFNRHLDLVAHIPVRNIGTIGGNLYLKHANNEFPSDLFLLFETVGGMITIAEAPNKQSTISLLDFLKHDMKRKVILNVVLPPLSCSCEIKTYKIMPRSQNAHAIVNAGILFKFKQNDKIIEKATIVFGGISPNFVHAVKTEEHLVNKDPFTDETLQMALKNLQEEINPLEAPPEPSAQYRKLLALALFYKAVLSLCPEGKLNEKYRSGGEVIKRKTSKGTQTYDTDETIWPLNKPVPKLEGLVQCSGEATFANDLPSQTDEVYGAFVTADVIPGSILAGFDTSEAFTIQGVIAFYTAKDIPGENNFTPTEIPILQSKEEILCSKEVKFYGQPVAIIVANREKVANRAAKLVKVKYETASPNTPLLTVKNVLSSQEKDNRVSSDAVIEPTDVGNDTTTLIYDELVFETQYHYYMEPQTCVARPTEDGLDVFSSTQWLDLTNIAVAKCLNVPVNSINVIVRRVGGAYGGKITRSAQIACAAAIVTRIQGKPCRFILPIEDNMRVIGKRAPTYCKFEAGVNENGEIQYLNIMYYQDNGCSKNETITQMTIRHFPNCYDSKRWRIEAFSAVTDTPSTTWCRAPASTEGLAVTEYLMEKIAHNLNKDPMEVRLANMEKEDNPIPELIDQLKKDSSYESRLEDVKKFNDDNRWRKRALKLMPMTYELFYFGPFNCLISIYHADGTVAVSHGCTEMGQGINTKTAQVCAYALGIPLEKVSIKPSSSFTSPNSMATGGSIGSECIAYAALKACEILMNRLKPIREKLGNPSWEELVKVAFLSGVYLQASYMFSMEEPVQNYDIYGVIALEVEVDILTGNHDVLRVDLLEDTGRSLNPEIDIGQIEGAFVMGLGYWTSEKIMYDDKTGKLLTDRTWTYKPPGIKDIPADFRIYFRRNSGNKFGVLQSKATGEPAFCLAAVITHAFRETVRMARLDAGYDDAWVHIGYPCTTENIFMSVEHKLEHFKPAHRKACSVVPSRRPAVFVYTTHETMQLQKHLKIAAGSAGAAVFGVLFGWVIFPAVLKSQLKKEMALSKKTDVRQMWEKIPFALDFKVYLFNYTNPEEIQNGALPIVKEIGPYYFEEWKEKVEIQDQEDTDTISYKKLDAFYFKKELSGPGLTGEEVITMPHPFVLGMVNLVYRDRPAMMNMLGKAINGIFDNPPDMFIRVPTMDLLFRGVLINCSRTDFAPKAACTALKKEAADRLIFEPNNQYRFSLFGMRNATVDKHVITVKRGIKNVMEVGRVLAVDGKMEQEIWTGTCNGYNGTDGTVFPPFLTEFDRLESYSGDLCRTFRPWYQKKTSYKGIKTNRYIANIGDLANDPDLQCFCGDPDKCPPKGLMDLTKCLGVPMYASMPHFYDSDPELAKNIKGLSPDRNEHEIVIDFEPITGTPMVAKQRVQFSMLLLKTEKIELCKDLPNVIAPLFWIEEGLALNKTFVNMLKHQLFIPKRIVGVLRWLLVAGGVTGVLPCLLYHFKDHIMRFAVKPDSASVSKVNPENGDADSKINAISSGTVLPKIDM
ncbi:indole-3-acetaldehyde oxidase-like [Maniola jurtina]|uniref:indole-3-acetaldehyde oxidase-like n=1 Tax=Maniola jurtina TaxID=191418 RepID=UPI001E689B1E|nr:indole-3-acetaldehyde oxidase-like [Maniola jurtina]